LRLLVLRDGGNSEFAYLAGGEDALGCGAEVIAFQVLSGFDVAAERRLGASPGS
jgi:hypothetical protein